MMEEKTCETCAHYVQHYRKSKKGYSRIALGHCTTPRVKPRLMETPACPHYAERDGESNSGQITQE